MSSFWFVIKRKLTPKEISILSNSSHFEWRAGLSDTILKGDHPRTIPAKFALIWFSGFRGEDLNVIFYQNISNLYNQYKSVERKISQKNPEYYMLFSYQTGYIMWHSRLRIYIPWGTAEGNIHHKPGMSHYIPCLIAE